MSEEDCKNGCIALLYEKVLKDIHDIYNPVQLNPLNHAYASSLRRKDEVRKVIKKFVEERLTKYQRTMEE